MSLLAEKLNYGPLSRLKALTPQSLLPGLMECGGLKVKV